MLNTDVSMTSVSHRLFIRYKVKKKHKIYIGQTEHHLDPMTKMNISNEEQMDPVCPKPDDIVSPTWYYDQERITSI